MASPVIVDVAGAVPIVEPAASSDSAAAAAAAAAGEEMPPIMQFMYFHKAIRAELEQLHRDALRFERERGKEMEALVRRYQFLRTVYEHHSSAEDEVILPALDARVKNVAHSYSLEHQVESSLFQHLFEFFNAVPEADGDELRETLRNVVCSSKALLTTLSQHLSKEEEQVFPLLVKHFSYDEQATLVWQFLCSIPVNLIETFLPWLASSLSLEDREQMMICMRRIVPSERLLQQVVFAWLRRSTVVDSTLSHYEEEFPSQQAAPESKYPPINELLYWHKAIRKEMEKLGEEAKMLRSSSAMSASGLSSFIDRLRFLIEVCMFHSAAEDKVLFPAVDQKANNSVSFITEHAHEKQNFEMVQRLTDEISCMGPAEEKADELCTLAEHVMQTLQQHFIDEEIKVIPLAQKYFTVNEQRVLLYQSLRVMPLRLLERVIPWFVELLSVEEAKDMLQNMSLAAPVADKHLVALLSGWACRGQPKRSGSFNCLYSCEAQDCPVRNLTSEQSSDVKLKAEERSAARSKRPRQWDVEDVQSATCKNAVSKQCCVPGLGMKCTSLGITRTRKPIGSPTSSSPACSVFGLEKSAPKPIDHIFQFHKAIRKDLEYLDAESAKLGSCDEGFLRQFSGRFQLLWGLYRAHSNAEDDIVFPALEAKEALHNVSHSYSLDHKQEESMFEEIAGLLREMSQLFSPDCQLNSRQSERRKTDYAQRLQGMCKSVRCSLDHHVAREEHELWPLFDIHFSFEEQDRIVGRIVGTTGAEVLQSMIPWVTASLTEDEQNVMMDSWKQATKNTMFDKWLSAWWENGSPKPAPSPPVDNEPSTPPSGTSESLQLVAEYLAKSGIEQTAAAEADAAPGELVQSVEAPSETPSVSYSPDKCKGCSQTGEVEDCCMRNDVKNKQVEADTGKFKPGWQDIFRMNQKELEAAIRRVSNDGSLDPRRKAYLIQNLMTSRWIASQQHSQPESDPSEDIPGRSRSFNDASKGIYGCEHYKRNCKVRAACCGSLFTCRFCHDKSSDHPMDRHATKEMMCMQCLEVQPVAECCNNPQCNGLRMAKYYCSICRFFDDENRDIYHCPFCNLCRRGKGLGIDYFHCMTCNACMNVSLKNHKCREKGLESNCPICHDFLFTSSSPVKALPCNHFMHSDCFQAYTCCHYTCPICCKSLGDMSVYFGMLDALLAAEQLPDDYKGRVQDILCNDCEQKGSAPYHWLYHKCSSCGSYNTRTIYDGHT